MSHKKTLTSLTNLATKMQLHVNCLQMSIIIVIVVITIFITMGLLAMPIRMR